MKEAKLTLVGAGPGDPELITLKAVSALEAADVVLYDALVNPILLNYAKRAKKIFVGKRKGNHIYSQEAINDLIVKLALEEGHVVRLKGGDPFVFGRGSEEIAAARSFGIEVVVVPGISSSVAVPASQGISVTQRQVSESFWVITGTTHGGQISEDISLAARSTATVVILMGMGKLAEIMNTFRLHGKGSTPVAVIQNGTRPDEKTGLGTVDTIDRVVREKNLGSPAIIIVGEVVRHSQNWNALFQENRRKYA